MTLTLTHLLLFAVVLLAAWAARMAAAGRPAPAAASRPSPARPTAERVDPLEFVDLYHAPRTAAERATTENLTREAMRANAILRARAAEKQSLADYLSQVAGPAESPAPKARPAD